MKEKKCKNCRILENKLLQLSRKYEDVISLSMRGKTIEDVERTLAERKILDIFRKHGVFSPQSIEYGSGLMGNGIKQSFDWEKAKEIINLLPNYL